MSYPDSCGPRPLPASRPGPSGVPSAHYFSLLTPEPHMDFVLPPVTVNDRADFLPLSGEINWGMDAFGVARLRELAPGEGVVVGGVDTGVDPNHPLIKPNLLDAMDATGSRYGYQDMHGHGTHITGTICATDQRIGVRSKRGYVHGKGLGDSGSGSGQAIVAAMNFCAQKGAKVISMSLGSAGEDPSITGFIRELSQQKIWVVCAAGNSGPDTVDADFPGRTPYCISVAALNSNMTSAQFSNSGDKLDTSGPGVNIWSCAPGGGFAQMSGTSMATPFVAAVLAYFYDALLAAKLPIPTVEELRAILAVRSTDIGQPGDDLRTGPGWVTPLLLGLSLVKDPLPVK